MTMMDKLAPLHDIFDRTQYNIQAFMNMLSPVIAEAQDEHQRLYFHHIYEEEEQRLDRLQQFVPKLALFIGENHATEGINPLFISLLQDINLEKFGLHNFLEHLDLALYQFQDEERTQSLTSMRDQTRTDYLQVKEILTQLNQQFLPDQNQVKASDQHQVKAAAHDHDHEHEHHHEVSRITPISPTRKGLTVGSLRGVR